MKTKLMMGLAGAVSLVLAQNAMAACSDIDRTALQNATNTVVNGAGADNGGLGFPMWVTVVNETGKVCGVVTSGNTGADVGNDKWLGSRVISAQKANTANAFSIDTFALSTANLYSVVQPGGSLFGLQESNPVDATKAYNGSPVTYGTNGDPLKNKRVGGVNVFGGGLALYNAGTKVGAIGVSGDTSCTDHVVAWKIRAALGLAATTGLGGAVTADAMIQDIIPNPTGGTGLSTSGFGHPTCLNNPTNANDGGSIDGN